jgi:hypothetical protein
MLNEIPTPPNLFGSPTVDSGNDLSFDGTQVPYWLGGTQGTVEKATTSVGSVYVPANTPANNAGQNMGGPATPADPTLEDFFNPYSPLFFGSFPDLPVVQPKKKDNTALYVGAAIIAALLLL